MLVSCRAICYNTPIMSAEEEHLEFLKQVERDERENRKRNLLFGSVLFVAVVIGLLLLGMAGAPVRWGPVP